jgi:predicted lipid-binding transport protein (Tim44 family)
MSEAFDPFNLLILAIALFILWRLRGVLGRRTGSERKPFDPFNTPEAAERNAKDRKAGGNVVTLSDKQERAGGVREDDEEDDRPPVWQGVAESGTPLAESLAKIARIDRSFEPGEFLKGARTAYEMIVTAFDAGDRRRLKSLLGKDVYDAFDSAISDREAAGNAVESNFVGIDSANIIDASMKAKSANITVKFVSQLISATRNRDGKIVEGDLKKVREVTDIWTFMRDLSSKDPNWKLIATEAAN